MSVSRKLLTFLADSAPPRALAFVQSLAQRHRSRQIGRRDDEVVVPIEPLAFWPGRASAILQGDAGEPSPVQGYAFHTHYINSTGGQITFRVVLTDLTGTRGDLLVNINGLDQKGQAVRPISRKFRIHELIQNGGVFEMSTTGRHDHTYAIMGIMAQSDATASAITITVRGSDTDDAYLARLNAAKAGFLAAPGDGPLADIVVDRPASLIHPISQMCTASQFDEEPYRDACRRLGESTTHHRKQWEFVYILTALDHYGALRPGARGLGFGVGQEPLPSFFASLDCAITATDLHEQDQRARVWVRTNQLSSTLDKIFHPHLCDEEKFRRNVQFRSVDMNAIPDDLRDFDFTWSSCAYEHLGSIEAGLAFFENSLACLAPGGLAVHTTELNLTSNDATLDHGTTVLFRRRDFEELARRLAAKGHEVMPITFDSGGEALDRVIDVPPYESDPHLKLALMRWVSTSFGMVVRKCA